MSVMNGAMVAGQTADAEQRAVRGGPAVPARMAEVQRRHFAGQSTGQIAAALTVAEGTVRADLRRLAQRWQAQIDADASALRAALVAQLDDLKHRAIAVAEFDERAERAVLFGECACGCTCSGCGEHCAARADVHQREPATGADVQGQSGTAQRGSSRRVPYRGQKTQALNVARQCVMDQARVLGLMVERPERSTPVPVRIYELEIDGQAEVS